MAWWLKIIRNDNGYILHTSDNRTLVVQEDKIDDLKAHEELLWEVMEYFNFGGSKHDEERIRVVREKRDV